MKLIPCLLSCLKKKGMSPFGKIFAFLSSIPKYQKALLSQNYPQIVQSLLIDKKFNNVIIF